MSYLRLMSRSRHHSSSISHGYTTHIHNHIPVPRLTRSLATTWEPPELPTIPDKTRSSSKKSQTYELTASLRPPENDGSRWSRRYRNKGLVPGVVFGNGRPKDPAVPWAGRDAPENYRILVLTSHQAIQRELVVNKVPGGTALESRVYKLTISEDFEPAGVKEGDVLDVVPRHVQFHPLRNDVLNLNYLRYFPGRVLKVPLRYGMVDESPALKRGAFVLAQNRFVDVTVEEGGTIPEFVEVNCAGLRLKDKVRRDRLVLPKGCEWGREVGEDFLVGSVFGRAKTAGATNNEEEKA
mmetsp:Transcript_23721/g.47186  ORF Transcript_23721/g.47186 Transcript_23721/m.47186 type:complete len:295 (-) Transcript_23721:48-932(-)